MARYERPDLEARLHGARGRLAADHVRVLVVGEFKQGKSLLVNALVGVPVCPVHDDIATSVATVLSHAASPVLTVTTRVPDPRGAGAPHRVHRADIPLAAMGEAVAAHVTEWGNPGNRQGIAHVEVGLPSAVLESGLQIVDTPGVGGLRSVHGAATMAALSSADAVLLVSDASQEYTAPELEFLRQAIRVCPNVVCVLTKIDIYPEWRRVAESDAKHLREAGIVADLVAVSSAMRVEAEIRNDPSLAAESGFPVLERYLADQVVGQADLLARRSVVHDVITVTEQVGEALRAEEASHQDPQAAARIIEKLKEAQERAVALRERSARWQVTLSDGIADLNADVDHDMRDRMREIVRAAEVEIDEGGDPTRHWPRHTDRLRQECASAVAANYLRATELSRELARRTARHFAEEHEAVLPALRIDAPPSQIGAEGDLTVRDHERWNLGNKALTALRGGYIGVLMFGMLGSVAGMSLVNPFSIGAGVLLGGKAISDERRRIVARRQADAKTAVRRHVDEVAFQVGKDSREMLRVVQRDLRDHYSELAEQLNRSLRDSVASAERSVLATQAERDRRLAEIPLERATLAELQAQVRTLLAPTAVRCPVPVDAPPPVPVRPPVPDERPEPAALVPPGLFEPPPRRGPTQAAGEPPALPAGPPPPIVGPGDPTGGEPPTEKTAHVGRPPGSTVPEPPGPSVHPATPGAEPAGPPAAEPGPPAVPRAPAAEVSPQAVTSPQAQVPEPRPAEPRPPGSRPSPRPRLGFGVPPGRHSAARTARPQPGTTGGAGRHARHPPDPAG